MEQISADLRNDVFEVLWRRLDGTLFRKTYTSNQKEEFLAEVIGAEALLEKLSAQNEHVLPIQS